MAKYTGKGSDFLMKGASAYTTVGQIMNIGSIAQTADEVDATTLDAGAFRDFVQGFKDTGECPLELAYDPAAQGHKDVITAWEDGTTKNFAIKLGTTPTAYMLFDGFVRDMNWPELNP